MKLKFIIPIVISLFSVIVAAQSTEKGKIGISYSPFAKSSFLSKPDQSALTSEFYKSTSVGLHYLKPANEIFSWETGLEYTLMKVQSFPTNNTILPNDTSFSTLSMIEIPLAFRAEFADILFFTGGILLDFDLNSSAPISKQNGVGLMAGLGLNYDFKMGLSLFANPFVKLHSLIPFGTWENHQRVLDAGVRVGVMYRL